MISKRRQWSLLTIFLVPSVILAVCLFRAFVLFTPPRYLDICSQLNKTRATRFNTSKLIETFSEALKFQTITKSEKNYAIEQLTLLRQFIIFKFPVIHTSSLVKVEVIANYSLLYTLEGSRAELKPYMLCSHLDVVPAERAKWTHEPFGGQTDEDYIYGRGTLDAKHTLFGILEALEYLLTNGFRPKRTILVAFGHDEEGSGLHGAATISDLLEARYGKLEFIIDEGTPVTEGVFAGMLEPFALISVTEKGYMTVRVEVFEAEDMHEAIQLDTPVTKLAKALSKFNSKLFRTRFESGPVVHMLESIAPYASLVHRIVYSNLWLFGPVVVGQMSRTALGDTLLRTTTAVTLVSFDEDTRTHFGLVNHRILPGDTVEGVLVRDKDIVSDIHYVRVVLTNGKRPHPVSDYGPEAFGYQVIGQTIRQIFGNVPIVPGVFLASTDTNWYLKLTTDVYRFTPVRLTIPEMGVIHNHNEKISVDNYLRVVNFYHHLILNCDTDSNSGQRMRDEL